VPQGEIEPSKYFLSTLPADISCQQLVAAVKIRWRIERDYQELKQEFGLDNFEGRNWRGFHHHATLCIAAYGFLVSERLAGGQDAKKLRLPRAVFPTRRLRPAGRRFVLNAMCNTQFRPYVGTSPPPSLES
jgi:SRSO17 transposase